MDTSSTANHSDLAHVLVADIGGTNARFALVHAAQTASGSDSTSESNGLRVDLKTDAFPDAASLVARAREKLGVTELNLRACAMAIAGPVAEGRGRLTNGSLEFDEQTLGEMLRCPATVLNDFTAVAASISDASEVLPVGPLSRAPDAHRLTGVRAVLGPGTGLGMGYLAPEAADTKNNLGGFRVFSSEGGNADFAPVDALELELLGILQRTFSTVTIETLVSGRGLPNLYAALCELWGAKPVHTSAEAISQAGLDLADPVSHKTLELFCAMLGTAAGNFALTVGARGGVYLAGGILPRMRAFFCASDFRRRFDDRGPLAEFNRQIPTFLVLDPEPGLTGAIRCARALLVD